ncbi:MAG: hypothetical protein Q4D96_00100 [Propionibacteriaceae bacterium]|nr:hypothetical protein [Propionibacteriaceae bacterium]
MKKQKGRDAVRTRRRLLVGAGALAGVAVFAVVGRGCMSDHSAGEDIDTSEHQEPDGDGCRVPGELTRFDEVGGGALGYESDAVMTSMQAEPSFLRQLDDWAREWAKVSGLGPIKEMWSYGAFTDKCHSYHQLGRAFDIGRIVQEGGEVSCRLDLWAPGSPDQLRAYWRLAASLHSRFAYTLTHLYDDAHLNHIHIDNSVNGNEATSFSPRSRVQVQFVQASLQHVHGQSVAMTGEWDQQTQDALRAVQRSQGITQPLGEREGWQAYLRATVAS